ncbi:MAG: hypothetical protein EOP84_19245 [Verrucomicrobiaceae bacterium]|nr:MAG: hypothetical protein EOP84_19245 [Verrucomicrobiaceae bacterium]
MNTATLAEVSDHLGISARRVQQLAAQEIIPKPDERGCYDLRGAVRGYIESLRNRGAAKADGYAEHKARREKALADLATLDVAERVKRLIPITDALLLLEGTAICIRQKILGSSMPVREQHEILTELCKFRPEPYIEMAKESMGIEISYKSGLYDDLFDKPAAESGSHDNPQSENQHTTI